MTMRYRRAPSRAGNCEYRLLGLCFDKIAGRFQRKMRDAGQFVGRNHTVDNGGAVGLGRLVDGIAQLAGTFSPEPNSAGGAR